MDGSGSVQDQQGQPGQLIDRGYLGNFDIRIEINEHMERARSGQRVVRDIDTLVALKWYGNQPYFRRSEANRLQEIKPEFRKRYVTINKLHESIRTVSASLTYAPQIEPYPRTEEPGDWARARMNQSIGSYITQTGGFNRCFAWAQDLVQLGGYCVIKPIWDPTAGEARPVMGQEPCPTCGGSGGLMSPTAGITVGCPTCSAQGLVATPQGHMGAGYVQRQVGTKPEGNVRFELVPPWEFFPDPDAPTIHDNGRVVHRRRMSRREVWQRFGKAAGFKQSDFHDSDSNMDTGSFIMRNGPWGFGRADDKYLTVYELWQNPDEEHPEGIWAVMVGDEPIIGGPYPYVLQRHPFFVLTCYEVYGSLYPLSTADLILPLCMTMNDHASAIHARERLASRLRWLAPRESRVTISERDGNINYVHAPGRPAPQPAQLQPASGGMEFVQFLMQNIQSSSGSVEVLRGETSQGIESARGGAWFGDQALAQFRLITMNQAASIEEAVKYGIDLFRLHTDDGRKLRTTGAGGAWEVHAINLEGMGTHSDDVRIVLAKDQGRPRSAKMAELNEAADRQMVDPATYQRLAEFGEMGLGYKDRRIHENIANTELETLKNTGFMPPPTEGQNHLIQGETHRLQLAQLQSENFQDPAIGPLLEHIRATDWLKNQEAVRDQMEMQASAQQFGLAGAGMPSNQTPQAQEQVTKQQGATAQVNAPQGVQPQVTQPETQPSLQDASAASRAPLQQPQ